MNTNKEYSKDDINLVLDKFKEMSLEDKKKYLKSANISKEMVYKTIEENNSLFMKPLKPMLLKEINQMTDDEIIDFVATKVSMISPSLISKFIKKTSL